MRPAPNSWDTTTVMPFPTYSKDADPTAFIGGVSMGFYLSRKAWDDPAKRDAAVSLLAYLTTGDNAVRLGGFSFGGGGVGNQMLAAERALIQRFEQVAQLGFGIGRNMEKQKCTGIGHRRASV